MKAHTWDVWRQPCDARDGGEEEQLGSNIEGDPIELLDRYKLRSNGGAIRVARHPSLPLPLGPDSFRSVSYRMSLGMKVGREPARRVIAHTRFTAATQQARKGREQFNMLDGADVPQRNPVASECLGSGATVTSVTHMTELGMEAGIADRDN